MHGGTRTSPLCARCVNPDPDAWARCRRCQITWQATPRQCQRCTLDLRLLELLSRPDADVGDQLQPLYRHLLAIQRPRTAIRWLARSEVASILTELGTGQRALTHEALDELPHDPTLTHLRAVLTATGVLPQRDERLAWLEQWTRSVIAARTDPDEQQLLRRYGLWHVLRRLRARTTKTPTTWLQMDAARCRIRAATNLLDWLSTQNLTLATCATADIERWMTSEGRQLPGRDRRLPTLGRGPPPYRPPRHRHTSLERPGRNPRHPAAMGRRPPASAR